MTCVAGRVTAELEACWEFPSTKHFLPIEKTTLPPVKRELQWEKLPAPSSTIFFSEQSGKGQREWGEHGLWLTSFCRTRHTWGNSKGVIHNGRISLLADISQLLITCHIFPFAIPALEGSTHFYKLHRGISFRKEAQHRENHSVNTEYFHLTAGGNAQPQCLSVWFFRVRTPRSSDEETAVSPLGGPMFQLWEFPLSHAQFKEKTRVFEILQWTEKHFIKIQLRHNSLWVGTIAKHSTSFAVKKWMWNLYCIPHKCSPFGFSCHQNCYYEIMYYGNTHYGEFKLEKYNGNLLRVHHIDVISNT